MQLAPFIFIGFLDGGCEEKKHNARYSQQLKTGTGQRASFRTVPPPRDRLPTGGQSELILWWFVPDHIHSVSSSTPMFRPKRLALAVTLEVYVKRNKLKGIILNEVHREADYKEITLLIS